MSGRSTRQPARGVAERAGELLGGAGHRAFARGDMPAAVNLLARATSLLPDEHPTRLETLPELGSALMKTGDFGRVDEVLSEALVIAGRWGARAEALERALEHARRVPDAREESTVVALLAQALEYGPTPVPEAIRRCEEIRDAAPDDASVAAIASTLGALHAMEGDFDEARELCEQARALWEQVGRRYLRMGGSLAAASVELLAGDPEAAVRELRWAYDELERMGERGMRSTVAAFLAQALVAQGRYQEAEEFTQISEETGAEADVVTQAIWRSTRAHALAHRGNVDLAEQLAREAIELAAGTDFLDLQAEALLGLAEVLRAAGRAESARPLVELAKSTYERKGNVVGALRAGASLAQISA